MIIQSSDLPPGWSKLNSTSPLTDQNVQYLNHSAWTYTFMEHSGDYPKNTGLLVLLLLYNTSEEASSDYDTINGSIGERPEGTFEILEDPAIGTRSSLIEVFEPAEPSNRVEYQIAFLKENVVTIIQFYSYFGDQQLSDLIEISKIQEEKIE